jgi:DNA-binding transcriptional LysR family regulator
MVPGLLRLLKQEAPLVNLVIRPDTHIDLIEQIDLGQIDAAIGSFSIVPARFRASPLFAYDEVLIANSSRKLGRLSREMLSTLSIAVVSLHGEQGMVGGFVSQRGLSRRSEMYDRTALERALSELGRVPQIAVSLPHFLALPALLEDTDVTAIVPRPLARSLASVHQITVHELPYNPQTVDVSVLWHERTAKDAPQQWLRELLNRTTEPLRSSPDELEYPSRPATNPVRCARTRDSIARLVSRT